MSLQGQHLSKFCALSITIIRRLGSCAHRVALAVLCGGQAASAENCTHPAKCDYWFPPPITEGQRLPNVWIEWAPSVFSCNQAALWIIFSVRLSHLFDLCSHHRIIMKFAGVITNDKSKVHAKSQGQTSKVKVTEVTTQLNRFRTVTPVWIHIWWWNDAYSLMLLRRGALLFFKVICQISRSHGSKNRRIWPRLGVSWL